MPSNDSIKRNDGNKTTAKTLEGKLKEPRFNRVPCGGNLFFVSNGKGNASFILRYKFGDKVKEYSLGSYRKLSLSQAREERDRLKILIKDGIDPKTEKLKKKLNAENQNINTFQNLADEWFKKFKKKNSEPHYKKIIGRFDNHVFPYIGKMPIEEIDAQVIFSVLNKIGDRPETCRKTRQILARVFSYAISSGRLKHNPVNDTHLEDIVDDYESKNMPHLLEDELQDFFDALKESRCERISLLATMFAVLTFLRPSEQRKIEWGHVSIENLQIYLPAEVMTKNKRGLIIPISPQLDFILRELKKLNMGSELLFPLRESSKKAISGSRVLNVIKKVGYQGKASWHGWRHTFSTICHDSNLFNSNAIELQLDHDKEHNTKSGKNYDKSQLLDERIKLMNWYSKKIEGYAKWFFKEERGSNAK